KDPGLTTKLLHMVNSAQFGTARRIVSAAEAVQILGVEVLRALTLGIQTFDFFTKSPFARKTFHDLWNHSLRTAMNARKIARLENASSEMSQECFLAGLLHDIGKLILAANAETEYRMVVDLVQRTKLPADQAEMGIFGSTHAQIGAYMLVLWGLPESV